MLYLQKRVFTWHKQKYKQNKNRFFPSLCLMLKLWATLLLLIILIDAWGVTEKVACKSSKKK